MTYEEIINSTNINDFLERLNSSDCRRCSLSEHNNRIVTHRGNPSAKIMGLGEAPGLVEDQQRKAFVGPAGQLLEKIMASVGISLDNDMYIGNICKCRPVASPETGKQNYTPLVDQRLRCIPYVTKEIELINPSIVILMGLTAAQTLLGTRLIKNMGSGVGRWYQPTEGPLNGREAYVIYHPAYIIHAQKNGREIVQQIKMRTWEHVKDIRRRVDELGIEVTEEYTDG